MALTSLLFVPQYWTPPSLFDLDQKIRVGIEDVLWAAAGGGIASVIGEILLKERLSKMRGLPRGPGFTPFLFLVLGFVALVPWHSGNTIYNTILAFSAG